MNLLAPLFDFVPRSPSLDGLPVWLSGASRAVHRPVFASSYFPGFDDPTGITPSALPKAPILPGSALHLLNQGRAHGLFTPSSSSFCQPDPVHPSLFNDHTQAPPLYPFPTYSPASLPQSTKRIHPHVVSNAPT